MHKIVKKNITYLTAQRTNQLKINNLSATTSLYSGKNEAKNGKLIILVVDHGNEFPSSE